MHINQGWLVEALDGHYGAKSMSRNGYAPKFVVLHGTAGGASAAAIDDFFTNGTDSAGQPIQASAHVIIGQDGTVIQGISFDLAAWGNGYISAGHASFIPDDGSNPNWYTISIEHVKSTTDNSSSLTDAQFAASVDVVRSICQAYSIPMRAGDGNGGIISHADIDPVNRSRCPGAYPWDKLFAQLSQKAPAPANYNMAQAMLDTWNASPVRADISFASGIAKSWQSEYRAGRQYGPALTAEYTSVDWSGNKIIVQEFPGARCEWSNGTANWIKR